MLLRLRHGGWARLVVLLGLAAFVVAVYVAIVVAGELVLGRDESPSMLLSVLATTVVALLFARVQDALERATTRWRRGAATPYDVLTRFSDSVTSAYATDELPGPMAMILAQGTGASWAQVWLNVSGRLTLAATWPADADSDGTPPVLRADHTVVTEDDVQALPVRNGPELLGVLRLRERPGLALTRVEERLFAGLAAQAGLVLRSVGLQAELDVRRAELLHRSQEITASRERLIDAQDAERRRLERDLHDGAQQHLVALTVNLRLAHTVLGRSPERAAVVLAEQSVAAEVAIETLASLSRGIYPRRLADEGLGAALRFAAAVSAVPLTVDDGALARLPAPVEAALYFCCMEAVQNAAKHSGATAVSVRVRAHADRWQLTVSDDGVGFDQRHMPAASGTGLTNMRDRLDAVGGTVDIASSKHTGTTVSAVVPRTPEVASPRRPLVPADRVG